MKNTIRKIMYAMLVLSAIISLTGCTDFSKRKAFAEYTEGLNDDVVYWEGIKLTSEQLIQSNDIGSYISHIGTIIGYMDSIVTNAENRNVQIYDPEIKSIDDYYVQALKNLKNGYVLMQEGLNEQNESKLDQGEKLMESSLDNLKIYCPCLKDYMQKYNIQSNVDMDELLATLSEQ